MASIVLGAAGSAVGAASGLPFGAALGGRLGQGLGNGADGNFLGGKTRRLAPVNGPRLADLGVQSSAYGRMIPIVYGTVRIAGNIIWSQPIEETAVTTTSSAGGGGGKGGGGKVSQSTTTYSYSVTLALAISEGPVDSVLRVWADAKQLDLSRTGLRIYRGDENQMPDGLIESIQGMGSTPAYRGLAYAVFEDFPMGDYGNRIPNFTFEVRRRELYPDYAGRAVEELVEGIVLIPGAGEFVYDTQIVEKISGYETGGQFLQQGNRQPVNMHNAQGRADVLPALDDLHETCPAFTWVSLVTAWFGTSMNASDCLVVPGVEYQSGARTSPEWTSAGYTRGTARLITQIDGSPQYGGTPDDQSLLRCIDEMRNRGIKVAFYPLIYMDTSGKPWRGELTGSPADVMDFFTRPQGYNEFILHYAALVAGRVDAFIVGSELKGMTRVTDTPGNYPGVNRLVDLAGAVRAILGPDVVITYAADWSEYHHTDGGWYHMDPLWSSPDIDVIGIDAYFPLSDAPQGAYDVNAAMQGWHSGEGYDWYYTDSSRTTQATLSPAYAIKNIAWFWGNQHINPNASPTGWIPSSKKVWFTEYGFPSVDGSLNQPNVFYSPSSSGSAFPYHSRGRVDLRAQRTGLAATQQYWAGSPVVERMFLWSWDARPYPYWPDLTGVWKDGAAWPTGHWVQGKLGLSSLAAIVQALCKRCGLSDSDIDVSQIRQPVAGYIISAPLTGRDAIETLQQAFFFDTVESGGKIRFVPRGSAPVAALEISQLALPDGKPGEALTISRLQETELPRRVNVVYLNRLANYQSAMQYAQRDVTVSQHTLSIDLPIVLSDQDAKSVSDMTLFSQWTSRTSFRFSLRSAYACLEPADVVTIETGVSVHRMRLTSIKRLLPGLLEVEAVAEDGSTYQFYRPPGQGMGLIHASRPTPGTRLELLDLPAFPSDADSAAYLRVAACGLSAGWTGAALYRSDDNGGVYSRLLDMQYPAAIGAAITMLPSAAPQVFDEVSSVTVALTSIGELAGVSELAVLNGANAALLGSEIIQFRQAELLEPGRYRLSGLLRGRLGTEWAAGTHAVGEKFVLLDGALARQGMSQPLIGAPRLYKAVTFGGALNDSAAVEFSYTATGLKPYSPTGITGSYDGSGNLTLGWIRRTRLGGEWKDGVDAALGEQTEAYEVDIVLSGTVLRTFRNLATPAALYTAAQQVSDLGASGGPVSVRVYQLSAMVGRGYPGEATV